MRLFELIDLKEDASVASTSAGSIAPVAMPLGAVQRRMPDSMFTGTVSNEATPNTPEWMKQYKKLVMSLFS